VPRNSSSSVLVNRLVWYTPICRVFGCPLACSKACLANHSVKPDLDIELTRLGVQKKQHEDFNTDQANGILEDLKKLLK
jgi:uncharacterized metal-binding protein